MTLARFLPTKENITAPTLTAWREHLLDWLLRGILAFWALGLLLALFVLFRVGWQTSDWAATGLVIGFFLVLAVVMVGITFNRRLHYPVRAAIFLVFIYLIGLLDLLLRGYDGDGRYFLLAFVVMTAVLLDSRRSLYALGLGLVTLLATAALQSAGWLTNTPFNQFILIPDFNVWLNSIVIYIFLGVTLILSLTYLIQSLDNSLMQSRQEQEFASAVLDTSGALVVVYDADGRIQRFNRAAERVTGYNAAETIGRFAWDFLLTPDGADLLRTAFAQLQAHHQPVAYESYWLTRAGERHLVAWNSSVVMDDNGRIHTIISTGIDKTAQQATEAERGRLVLAENEQRLLSETLAEATLSLTSQTRPEDVLDQILRQVQRIVPFKAAHIMLLTGETLQVARWQGYAQFGNDAAIGNLVQSLSAMPLEQEVITSRQPIVINDTRHDPRWIVFEETGWIRSHLVAPILQQDKVLGLLRLDGSTAGEFSQQDARRLQNLATTISIALQNARLLQETQRKARQVQRILDTVQDGILLLDASYRVELANPAAQAHLKLLSVTPITAPLMMLGGRPVRELLQPPPAGALWHEISLQKPPRTFEAVAQPVETESGGWVLVLRDTSEARKQQQYVQAQERLAMVGQMAAGIAHDFNNIMTVIILYTQMVLKAPNLPPDLHKRLETIFQQSRLAANLISQILDFSRHADMQRRPIHLLPFLKEMTKLLRRTLPENIELRLDYDEGEYVINADITRMQQAVMNLVVNARDAMLSGGKLTLDLCVLEVAEGEKRPLPDMPSGSWVRLQVKDSGTGIAPENLPRIFEPLFTTKERGKGTGLGLAQVHGIIHQHDGFVGVDSVLGEGTTISLYFPAGTAADLFPVERENVGVEQGGGQTILVVEDDQITREAICAILETFNYRTIAAASGEEAVRLFEHFGDEVALVLSDMVMPGMSGSALYAHLAGRNPAVQMIVVTGYPFTEQDRLTLGRGIVNWIQKPFEVEQIVAAIQSALAR
jgi:two-component system, cell cycle sensor histidine kinase and response regulator CckA